MKKRFKKIVIIFAILLPSIIRILLYNLDRIHGDELITGYFSAHFDILKTNFFAPVPTNPADWVSQFPAPFFFLQKIFFLIFGESLLTVKLSVIPYVLIVSVFLFLIAKKLFDKKTTTIALILYAFFSPALYLETLGLHFISSTAIFLIFFYFLLEHFQTGKIKFMLLSFLFMAFCYLFYSSSYIAFPIFIFVFLWEICFKKKRLRIFWHYLLGFLIFIFILSPFILNMILTKNFYITKRYDQVNLLKGEWSPGAKQNRSFSDGISLISENFNESFKSLYFDGIGGHGGYNFGHLAFFNGFNLWVIIFGTLVSFYFMIKRKQPEILFILVVIVVSFVTGVVLTIPPPAYHRFSLAFPFLCFIMATPLYFLFKLVKHKLISFAFLIVFLLFYCYFNVSSFAKQTGDEVMNSNIELSKLIIKKYPKRNIYVASFPGFAFQKIFYFVEGAPHRKIVTDYHINFLNHFNRQEKYLFVIIFPNDFNDQFKEKDPNGRIIKYSETYSLFVN